MAYELSKKKLPRQNWEGAILAPPPGPDRVKANFDDNFKD